MNFRLTVAQTVVVLTGELDIVNAPIACRALDAIDGPAVIDLAGVHYLSSAGLAEFARVAKRVGALAVTLANMQPQVLRVLQIVQFERLFILAPASGNGALDHPHPRL